MVPAEAEDLLVALVPAGDEADDFELGGDAPRRALERDALADLPREPLRQGDAGHAGVLFRARLRQHVGGNLDLLPDRVPHVEVGGEIGEELGRVLPVAAEEDDLLNGAVRFLISSPSR